MKRLKYLLFFLLLISQAFLEVYGQDKIKIACIGNSITAGYKLSENESYPFKLENLLGLEYDVQNFAVSGTTLLKDLHLKAKSSDEEQWSYWEIQEDGNGGKLKYEEALDFNPDIIIVKFGTNDARNENWTSEEGKKVLYKTYVEFINSFRAINPNAIFYICYPLPFRLNNSDDREQARVIREEIIPIIKQVARKNRVHLIDLHSAFLGKTGLMQSDGVHPNADGATLIAEEVFKLIKMTYKP